MDGGDDDYNDTNRAFLQAFMARGQLTLDDAKPILASISSVHDERECLTEDITEADFNKYIAVANNAISPFDLEIRSTYHQTTRKRIYALTNTTSDALTQLATVHTPDEISFLKRMLDAMFETYNTPRHEIMAITSIQATNLAKAPRENVGETQNGSETQGSAGQGLTMMQAEKMLKTLVEQGWFEKSRKGYYSLSPRALMELRGMLIETYNGDEDEEDGEGPRIKTCQACKDIITVGQRCSKRTCPVRLHEICTQQFFRTQDERKCPVCKAEWTGKDFVGERAAAGLKEKPRRSGGGSLSHRRAPSGADEGEDDDVQDITVLPDNAD